MHRLLSLLALLGLFTFGCAPADSGATPSETEATEPAGGEEEATMEGAMTEESAEETPAEGN